MPFQPGFRTPAGYVMEPVHFDGIVDYLTRGAGLSGAVDSKLMTFSCWVKSSGTATHQGLITGGALAGSYSNRILWNTSDILEVQMAAPSATLDIRSAALSLNVWHHVLVSVDMANTASRHIYIDDVSNMPTITSYTNVAIDFTLADWCIGGQADGAQKFSGEMADLWFAPGVYIDFSVTSNRRKFINNGKPVFLGLTGSLPTGTAPLVFMSGSASTWHTNDGTGGGFTEHGSITQALTSPSPLYETPEYSAEGVYFDGSTDYLTRGAAFTGAADSKTLCLSFWMKPAQNGVAERIFSTANAVSGTSERFSVTKSATNTIRITGRNAAATVILDIESGTNSVMAGNWYHVCCGIDLLNNFNDLFINDVDAYNQLTFTNDTIDWTVPDVAVGAIPNGGSKFTGDIADFWMDTGGYIDFSSSTNRRKFINALGDPVELGEYGEIPYTGGRPDFYFHGDTATWATNDGTGGGFTEHGALISSLTSPSPSAVVTIENSVYDLVQTLATYSDSGGPQDGGPLFINSQYLGDFDYTIEDGPVTVSAFEDTNWFTTTADSRSAIIVVKGDFTLNAGQVFIPDTGRRKLFTAVYVTGNCAINGELSMTARGANHSASGSDLTSAAIRIATGTYSGVANPQIPATGGTGGPSQTSTDQPGINGSAGTSGGSGGGGSGGADGAGNSGAGGDGTSFSGGSGGGAAASGQTGFAAEDRGGQGGDGNSSDHGAGGGVGNPHGLSEKTGTQNPDGTGGTLMLIVEGTLSGTGTITANGVDGVSQTGTAGADGGGSGGGSVTVLYGSDTSSITPQALGGIGGFGGLIGGAGGNGTARKLLIPGSQTFTANGTFTVPSGGYTNLTVTLWGGGGGGGAGGVGGSGPGLAGSQSKFNSTTAVIGNGGGGGGKYDGSNGTGGTASGGDTNTTGSAGSQPNGGASPNGGAAAGTATNGNIPGGGGGGGDDSNASNKGRGGGGGGYSTKTFAAGALTGGAAIAVTVGLGGAGVGGGGNGARGQVNISWT